MLSPPEIHRTGGASLAQAKRLFLLNLAFFLGLLGIASFLFHGKTEGSDPATSIQKPERELTPLELAHLKGQMLGLSQSPETVPEYDPEWVLQTSCRQIQRDPDFADIEGITLEQLIQAYAAGYSERYEDYYDTICAREAGCRYGLKYDPTIHPAPNKKTIRELLSAYKKDITEKCALDEAMWRLYIDAFEQGFNDEYLHTVDGITAHAGEKIRLEEALNIEHQTSYVAP